MEALNLNKRMKTICHEARKERRKGKIPGIIYGKEIGNEMFEVDSLDLEKELTVTGEHGVINFKFDGKKGTAVIKEIQKTPVGHKIVHVDLEEVAENAKMHTEVAIKFIGKGLLESKGLILQTQRDLVKVSCTAKDLPKEIELDVSNGVSGTVYTFKNLKLGNNIAIVDDIATVIGSISEEERIADEEDSVE